MIPILFQSVTEGTVPVTYGIGSLTDALEATCIEERNGKYELTLVYPASGIHAEEIEPNRFIMAKPNYTDDAQIFRIYKVGKTINGKFTVYAQHISYDLSGKVITTGTASSCAGACLLLEAQAGSFTINTDINTSAAFSITEPSSVRSWFGGKAGSLLDVYGGEWEYNNYTASLKSARGLDRGVTIRYGKNLTELSQTLDMSNLVTGIVPYYIDANGNKTVGTKVSTGLTLDVTRDIAIDFSMDVNPESGTAITTQLANLATAYKNNNNLVTINNSITLDFVQMGKLTERVDLCDTVHIYFEALGITAAAKCISTTWDILRERYTKTTFGTARTNIADTISKNSKAVERAADRDYVNELSQLITGNLGGYVINGFDSNGDGFPDENLIMDTPDISTATKVIRSNLGGIGLSTTGYAGPYTTAITASGIVADTITTGTLNANLIKAGTISDTGGKFSLNMTSGAAMMTSFRAKTKLSLINSSSVEKGVFYINGGDTVFTMKAASSSQELVKMWAQDANGAGVFQLLKTNGKAIIEEGLTGELGGGIAIRNTNDKVVGEYRTNTGNGGELLLYNSGGALGMGLIANDASTSLNIYNTVNKSVIANWIYNNAGVVQVRNSAETTTIELSGDNGQIICVSLVQTSSRKVKDNIEPIPDAKKILELDAVKFDYKNKALGEDKRGFIAEDVAEVLPNLVTPESEGRNASLDYIGMIPYLQAVIKEQEARISALEEKINKLGG